MGHSDIPQSGDEDGGEEDAGQVPVEQVHLIRGGGDEGGLVPAVGVDHRRREIHLQPSTGWVPRSQPQHPDPPIPSWVSTSSLCEIFQGAPDCPNSSPGWENFLGKKTTSAAPPAAPVRRQILPSPPAPSGCGYGCWHRRAGTRKAALPIPGAGRGGAGDEGGQQAPGGPRWTPPPPRCSGPGVPSPLALPAV